MKTVQDFNYKVALASGLKHLQSGKLRQAEEQFRYLVSKFPRADGGYRGLARVYVELGDRAAALGTLREGAAAVSRGGDRTVAIDMLREAVSLDPLDLSAHRRLAAALSLAGDANAAAQEYVRFTQGELAAGDADRAKLEAMYALETLGELPALHDLARTLGIALRTVRAPAAGPPVPVGVALMDAATPALDERAALFGGLAGAEALAPPAGSVMAEASTAREDLLAAPPATEWVTAEPAVAPPITPAAPAPASAAPSAPAAPDALALEERAAALIARKHPDAGAAAIEAASALLQEGKVTAASDLLLAMVATGLAVHDAQTELIGVAAALGRRDVAVARARLLASVMRLAGDEQRAAEIERIGETI